MKTSKVINPGNVSEDEAKKYFVREAVRAVVLDEQYRIAILYVKKFKYYKLPGGGVEKGESRKQALVRECLEEVGSKIEIIDEIGKVFEYRCDCKMKQISYCYLAKIRGAKGKPKFTNEEVEDGFELVWLPIKIALDKVSEVKSDLPEANEFIIPRSTVLLNEAKKYL